MDKAHHLLELAERVITLRAALKEAEAAFSAAAGSASAVVVSAPAPSPASDVPVAQRVREYLQRQGSASYEELLAVCGGDPARWAVRGAIKNARAHRNVRRVGNRYVWSGAGSQ